jgi:hypothetical protein
MCTYASHEGVLGSRVTDPLILNLGSNLEVSGQLHRHGPFTPAALRIGGWVGLTVRLDPL